MRWSQPQTTISLGDVQCAVKFAWIWPRAEAHGQKSNTHTQPMTTDMYCVSWIISADHWYNLFFTTEEKKSLLETKQKN